MACPVCGTSKVKRGERGLIIDTYICDDDNCGVVYEKVTPGAKKMAIGLGLAIVIGPAGLAYILHD